jgi:hypothetical protein
LSQIFRKDTTFQLFQFRCQQIDYVRDIAEREPNIPISSNAMGMAFDCPRSSVQSALAHRLELPGERGKHPARDGDREQQIRDWIQQKAEQSRPVRKTEIKDYCTAQLKVSITRGWVNSFVLRHSDQIFKTKSTPQEQQRLQVPRMFLERIVQDLKEHVQRCVVELVFNFDEVGISDWENRKTKTVIVPATMCGQTIPHEIPRIVKHISVIACVSAARESLTPYIITFQAPTSVQERLKK